MLEEGSISYSYNPEMQAKVSQAISFMRIADELAFLRKAVKLFAEYMAPEDDPRIAELVKRLKAL